MTDWIANGITITFGLTSVGFGIREVRKDKAQVRRFPDQADPGVGPYPTWPSQAPADPRPQYPTGSAYPSYPQLPPPAYSQPGHSATPPRWIVDPPPRWVTDWWVGALSMAIAITVIMWVTSQFAQTPIGQGLATGGLFAIVLVSWLIRRAGDTWPSYKLTGILLVLIQMCGVNAIMAVPLPSALHVPQLIVAAAVSSLLLAWLVTSWRLLE